MLPLQHAQQQPYHSVFPSHFRIAGRSRLLTTQPVMQAPPQNWGTGIRSTPVFMQKDSDRKSFTSDSRWIPELDHLLSVGLKHGRSGTHAAIEKVLSLAAGLTRGDCFKRIRYLRRHGAVQGSGQIEQEGRSGDKRTLPGIARQGNPARPWTKQDDKQLLDLAGYESVKRLSERLNRSESAIRFRLSALGARGRVCDAWSLRKLSATFHVDRRTLLGLIAKGQLNASDPRITRKSLLRLLDESEASSRTTVEPKLLRWEAEAYTWKQVAQVFAVPVDEVRRWIADGKVRIVNPSVAERALERFCKGPASCLNLKRIDPEELKWLIEEYGLNPTGAFDFQSEQADDEEGEADLAS